MKLLSYLVVAVLSWGICASNTTTEKCVEDPDAKLPFIQYCKRYDPSRDECIKNLIQSMVPELVKGYKPLCLNSIDPWRVPSVNPFVYSSGHFSFRVRFKNATVSGMRNSKVVAVRSKIDTTPMYYEVDVFHPELTFEALYRGEGNLNDRQLRANGFLNATLIEFSSTWKMDAVLEDRNGEKYMQILRFDNKPKIKSIKVNATGLIKDPVLNDLVLRILNDNWDLLYDKIIVQTRKNWHPIALRAMNRVVGRVPFRKLFYIDTMATNLITSGTKPSTTTTSWPRITTTASPVSVNPTSDSKSTIFDDFNSEVRSLFNLSFPEMMSRINKFWDKYDEISDEAKKKQEIVSFLLSITGHQRRNLEI